MLFARGGNFRPGIPSGGAFSAQVTVARNARFAYLSAHDLDRASPAIYLDGRLPGSPGLTRSALVHPAAC